MRQPVSTRTSRSGDRFTAELLDPVVDASGHLVVPAGAVVEGVVGAMDPSQVAGDGAAIALAMTGVRTQGEGVLPLPLEVATAPVEVESSWGQVAGLALAGLALGAGAGIAITRDEAAVPLALSVCGAGLGSLLGALLGRRDASIGAGSVITLRVREDVFPGQGLAGTGAAIAP